MNDERETTEIQIGTRDGKVIIDTKEGIYFFPPEVAVQIANAILESVQSLGFNVGVQADAKQITAMQRAALIARTGHILRTYQSRKPVIACTQIVDSILAEIL